MSLSVEGQKCPVCHAYLFDDDDVVFCPICGAPHHRDCYNAIGHCALEDKHGTDEQYDASVYKREETSEEQEEKAEESNVVFADPEKNREDIQAIWQSSFGDEEEYIDFLMRNG